MPWPQGGSIIRRSLDCRSEMFNITALEFLPCRGQEIRIRIPEKNMAIIEASAAFVYPLTCARSAGFRGVP